MNSLLTILITILVFGAIIFIHELGHFIAAKLSKVRVYEFNMGMGPVIFTTGKPGVEKDAPGEPTRYTLRAFPIGGSVQMAGEDEESEDQNSFGSKPIWKRFCILVAGATMNLLLGFFLLFGLSLAMDVIPTRTIASFDENALSAEGGLAVGDEIVRVNGRRIFVYDDVFMEIFSDDDGTVDFVVQREGERVEVNGVTFHTVIEEEVRELEIDFKLKGVPRTIGNAFSYSLRRAMSLGRMIWLSLGQLVSGEVGFDQLSGPVGVGGALGAAASRGMGNLLLLVAFLSINVGIFNLLPLPALDGGRLAFLLIEAILRRPIPAKYEGVIHAVGLLLLFGLMIAVTFKDVFSLFKPKG